MNLSVLDNLQIQQDYEQDEHQAFVFNITATRQVHHISEQFRKDNMMFSTDSRLNHTSAIEYIFLAMWQLFFLYFIHY